MSNDDLSPGSLPFKTRLRENVESRSFVDPEVALVVYDYVDLAKRMLLELRVRDFSAADVVALAAIMEARDRAGFNGERSHDV